MKKMMFIATMLLVAMTACQPGSRLNEAALTQDNPGDNVSEAVQTEESIIEEVEPEEVLPAQVKPEDVVLAQVEPMNHADINAALELYADDVELQLAPAFALLPGSPDHYRGKEALRAYFESLVESNIQLQIDVQQVEGNTVTTKTYTWMDLTRELGIAPLEATEVYNIEDGKIKSWTWTLSDQSLNKLQDSPPVFSITFQKDGCIYNGPKSVETPSAIIVWNDASGVERAGYAISIEKFEEGKTVQDRLGIGQPPEWTTIVGIDMSSSPSYQFFTPFLNDGPIYLVCLVSNTGELHSELGVVGPIMNDFWK